MADKDQQMTAAITRLLTTLELKGVAVGQVSDGHVYLFSKKKLLELVEACDRADGKVAVFIKHGDDAPELEPSN